MYFEGLVLEKHTNMIVFNNKKVLNDEQLNELLNDFSVSLKES